MFIIDDILIALGLSSAAAAAGTAAAGTAAAGAAGAGLGAAGAGALGAGAGAGLTAASIAGGASTLPLITGAGGALGAAAAPAAGGILSGLGGYAMPAMLGISGLASLMGPNGTSSLPKKEEETMGRNAPQGANRKPVYPGANYRPGIDPEFPYFSGGGFIGDWQKFLVKDPVAGGIMPDSALGLKGPMPFPLSQGGLGMAINEMAGKDSQVQQRMDELNLASRGHFFARGGTVKGTENFASWSGFPKKQKTKFADGGEVYADAVDGQGMADPAEIYQEALLALQGKSPDPEGALRAFIAAFGIEALAKLRAKIADQGGRMDAISDGMNDMVPATINGKQPARLSDGEFVVPSDAVSALGNGSSVAGAKKMQGIVDNIRQQAHGSAEQQAPVDLNKVPR